MREVLCYGGGKKTREKPKTGKMKNKPGAGQGKTRPTKRKSCN